MKILQSVTVKQVLTETTKKSISDRYRQEIQQLEKEIQQLQFEERKQLKNNPSISEIKTFFVRKLQIN
ncbi:YlqD family protein [Niallia circulans]